MTKVPNFFLVIRWLNSLTGNESWEGAGEEVILGERESERGLVVGVGLDKSGLRKIKIIPEISNMPMISLIINYLT